MSIVPPGPAAPAELADVVAGAALAVPGVAGLHTGTFGEVATYLPGRSVEGVRLRPERTEVHLVVRWGAPVLATADAVRAAVRPFVSGQIDVFVQDVVGQEVSAAPAAPLVSPPR